jgi:hypothetical protein
LTRILIFLAIFLLSVGADANESAVAQEPDVQKSLDKWCESAKENERQELKRRITEICESKGRPSKQCTQEAATYGSLSISSLNKSAELPVCAQANEYRKVHRSEK